MKEFSPKIRQALQMKWISASDLDQILHLQKRLLKEGKKEEEVTLEKLFVERNLFPAHFNEDLEEAHSPDPSPSQRRRTSLWASFNNLRKGGPPFVFGKYRVLSHLKEGGMGTVFLAKTLEDDRLWVLKTLPLSQVSRESRERFAREITILSEIKESPHIVKIRDWGTKEGVHYIAMDHLSGTTLNHIPRDLFSSEKWLSLFMPLLKAIHQLHLKKIIHRDLKPENIILTGDETLVLIDFGLGKILGKPGTLKTGIIGTPRYMSPEQMEGRSSINHLTDIWSMGVILYQLLSGRHPFPHEGPKELFQAVHYREPLPLKEANPHLSKEVCLAIHKALMRDLLDRHQSLEEMGMGLEG